MTRWPTYPVLKDSGVPWLGEIPAHWETKRLRFACDINPTKSEIVDLPKNTLVSFLPMEHIGEDGNFNLDENRMLDQVWSGYTYFRDGDIAVAKITPCFENGKGAIFTNLLNGIGFGTTELHVLRPQENVEPRFVFYLTRSSPFRALGVAQMYGAAGQQRVPEDFVQNFRVAFPPLAEQRAIAALLDRETARIDALAAHHERLIALLEERRAALIARAVTQGLDPAAPRKESGIEWSEEIPSHWEVAALKRWVETKITDGPHETPEFVNEGIPFVSAEAVQNGLINFDSRRGCIAPELHAQYIKKLKPRRDDIFIVKSGATTGKLAIVDVDFEFSVWSPLALIRAEINKITPRFLFLALQADYVQKQVQCTWSQGTQPNISMGAIERLQIVVPPLSEQRAIAAYLDRETTRIDALIGKARAAQARLAEYRAALITAAVTGKIDVRELV